MNAKQFLNLFRHFFLVEGERVVKKGMSCVNVLDENGRFLTYFFKYLFEQNQGLKYTYSQLYNKESPILTVKQVASLRQYQAAYAGGHLYV